MKDKLTTEEKLLLGQVEGMYLVNEIPFVVAPHTYKLMKEKMGGEWTEKYLIENKPIK